ncbi:MAG: FGGY family carbohydrate kinase [Candidatus Latescibacter sp.]|nr:FGGY family carbohydrate kinase [Candidatus Latescibacter sp.]
MYLLGFDVGSSSIKATVLDAEKGIALAAKTSPEVEMEIIASRPGWAEQHPHIWWEHVKNATAYILRDSGIDPGDIGAVGISYQMHGLVIVDKNQNVLRPSIIWCDSRAVEIGDRAFAEIGHEHCLNCLLNSPGNFTASKLKWVMENEPEIYGRIHKAMLPGEFIAMKMTSEIKTTPSGLSEAILWDYKRQDAAKIVLDYYGISPELIPEVVPTFSIQGALTGKAADELGLKTGTPVSYRAGDQPNNALSLNVLNPGEVAATAGTSGVVYGVTDQAGFDPESRVNTFVHVNHTKENPRYGVLLCINGTGILNRWIRKTIMKPGQAVMTYEQMNELALKAPVGAEGLVVLPYGNGAERTLGNRDIGASFHGLKFNTHNRRHFLRAAQEGIVFALNYGLGIAREMGVRVTTVRAGHTNMFLSELFQEAFAATTEATVELYNTDGSQGAARGAGIGVGFYKNFSEAFSGLKTTRIIEPKKELVPLYREAYRRWLDILEHRLKENHYDG